MWGRERRNGGGWRRGGTARYRLVPGTWYLWYRLGIDRYLMPGTEWYLGIKPWYQGIKPDTYGVSEGTLKKRKRRGGGRAATAKNGVEEARRGARPEPESSRSLKEEPRRRLTAYLLQVYTGCWRPSRRRKSSRPQRGCVTPRPRARTRGAPASALLGATTPQRTPDRRGRRARAAQRGEASSRATPPRVGRPRRRSAVVVLLLGRRRRRRRPLPPSRLRLCSAFLRERDRGEREREREGCSAV
uniref:Uncharacterized protein n=1 Tax=Oryza rufipogon TaxID=4529 RepID=A0A0E0QQK0_ORYRU